MKNSKTNHNIYFFASVYDPAQSPTPSNSSNDSVQFEGVHPPPPPTLRVPPPSQPVSGTLIDFNILGQINA